jgi:alpha-1,3-rhamnosyltransferase
MNKQPLVSVIVPAYNHELYIEEALQSVIDQTYKNIELIIINDGSKDQTAVIIKEFITKNRKYNINFIDKENEGVCKTMNKGLEIANGEYIAFIASDDVWINIKVEQQVIFMENNKNIGMVSSDAFFLDFDRKTDIKWSEYKSDLTSYFINGIQNCNMYDTLLVRPLICAVTVMIRKDICKALNYFDEQLNAEDTDMWLRVARSYPVGYIEIPLVYYRLHNKNISNNLKIVVKGLFQIMRKHFKEEPLKNKYGKKILIIVILFKNLLITRIKKNKISS